MEIFLKLPRWFQCAAKIENHHIRWKADGNLYKGGGGGVASWITLTCLNPLINLNEKRWPDSMYLLIWHSLRDTVPAVSWEVIPAESNQASSTEGQERATYTVGFYRPVLSQHSIIILQTIFWPCPHFSSLLFLVSPHFSCISLPQKGHRGRRKDARKGSWIELWQ